MQAASTMMIDEGDIASDLGGWSFLVLVFVGAGDAEHAPGCPSGRQSPAWTRRHRQLVLCARS